MTATTIGTANAVIDCVIYLRISTDPKKDGLAVERQRQDCEALAAARGWRVVAIYSDTVSASNRNVKRPEYDKMVAAFAAGQFRAIVCYDLDRLTRQPRQLEDWIDAAEEDGLVLVTANGEADLSTDAGRLFARMKAAVARAEIERKTARQIRANLQRREAGFAPPGRRLFGYALGAAPEVMPDESAVVLQIFERYHAGESISGLAQWLNAQEIKTARGFPFELSIVRGMLDNARYCGRMTYGARNPKTGKWSTPTAIEGIGNWRPIISEALFDACQARRHETGFRRARASTELVHIGSGVYLCGTCDRPLDSRSGPRYACKNGHLVRNAKHIDDVVLGVIEEALSDPLVRLGLQGDNPELKADAVIIADCNRRQRVIDSDYDHERISGARHQAASRIIAEKLDAAKGRQLRSIANRDIARVMADKKPWAAFNAAPVSQQKSMIRFLLTVRVLEVRHGAKFAVDSVAITRNALGAVAACPPGQPPARV